MIPKPGELLIMSLPGKSGLFLAVAEERDRPAILARFAGDGELAAKRFAETLEGLGFRYRAREEGDGLLREQAEEAGERPGGGLGVPGSGEADAPPGGPGPTGAPTEGRSA